MKLRLVVDVEYAENGISSGVLAANLRGMVFSAIVNGMLTEASDAEVVDYETRVEEVT